MTSGAVSELQRQAQDLELASRGIWINDRQALDRLIVITPEAFFVGNPRLETIAALRETVVGGADPLAAVGDQRRMKFVRLENMTKAWANLHGDQMNIAYQKDGKPATICTSFSTPEARTEAIECLARELGKGWRLERKQLGAFGAAVTPLIWLLIIAGGAAGLALIAHVLRQGTPLQADGRSAWWKFILFWLAETLGPVGVSAIGLVLAIGILMWLGKRIAHPPLMARLERV